MPINPKKYVTAIRKSGLTIYDKIAIGDPELWIPTSELESLLDSGLRGISLAGLALRTRSKVVKTSVCKALGYPVPKSFRKTQPRFPGQNFDTYTQKANNLQIWNEDLSPNRRYVLVRVSNGVVARVKVVTGESLARFDTTGTLTRKYQARCITKASATELISKSDTNRLLPFVAAGLHLGRTASPISYPSANELIPINEVFARLSALVGKKFADAGIDQERNRGAALHRLACKALGYRGYQDNGQFPDIRHQLLEVKLQTSPTIDLGLVTPESTEPLDVPMLSRRQIRHCDVRYGIFYGKVEDEVVTITNFFLSTGADFFSRFPRFQGKVLNAKLQIPLPSRFFES